MKRIPKIVPSILTDDESLFWEMLNKCQQFTDYVQIDIMDGEFVPSSSIGVDVLKKRSFQNVLRLEAHLMVKDPLLWLEAFKNFGAERIIFHFEIDLDHRQVIKEINNYGMSCFLAINPDTELDEIQEVLNIVDGVLFLSVNPGFYGSPFIPHVLDKIKVFREKYPYKEIGIDGGIKKGNIKEVASYNINYICVGSAILKADDPQRAYEELNREVRV